MIKTGVLKLLAVDSDQLSNKLIGAALQDSGLQILSACDPEVGFNTFLRERPQVVLLDSSMLRTDGTGLLERILSVDPGIDAIVITAHYSADSAVEMIQQGASDYIAKPLDIEKLRSRIARLLDEAEIRRKTLRLDRELVNACQFEGMVGRSPLMLDVFAQIRRVAPHFRTVLVTGATGTGKELVALALHRLSPVAMGRFVTCNCSALIEDLFESELFGHVRGAFTGAVHEKVGLFEHADKGTIFLDEIGELSLTAQVKLLRVLQNRQVQRVGSLTLRTVDVRVIAATHRNLKSMVRDGLFREDLYYRLAVAEIKQPALADRREDMPLLERYFIEKFAAEYGKTIAGLTRRAQARLATYLWPGNVRELENTIDNACMMTEKELIDISDLPERFRDLNRNDVMVDERFLSFEELQKRHLVRVLESVGGNKVRAAEILGIGRATIYQMLSRIKQQGHDKATA